MVLEWLENGRVRADAGVPLEALRWSLSAHNLEITCETYCSALGEPSVFLFVSFRR